MWSGLLLSDTLRSLLCCVVAVSLGPEGYRYTLAHPRLANVNANGLTHG